MALHGLHQVGQRRFQTLASEAVQCFADQDHRLSHGLVVDALAVDAKSLVLSASRPRQPNTVLAVAAGYGDDLVEAPALFLDDA